MSRETALYLASQSPRRRELLTQVGFLFTVISANINEDTVANESAEKYVVRLAKEKAMAGFSLIKQQAKAVLGSDTAVGINGEILGKPENDDDARRMLNLLSGNTHQVMTAVALVVGNELSTSPELTEAISVSEVTFKKLSYDEIERYVHSGECTDKAGSYAIQGLAAVFITHLSGSYSGVMGLPIYETVALLHNAGISTDSLVVS